MSNLRPHPKGLAGWLAELDARIKADDAVIARDSAMLADRLRRQGREAVAKFLADATRVKEVTPVDREALARFLVEHTPEDTLRDAAARRLRDAFLQAQGIAALFKPSQRVARIAALIPIPALGIAVVAGVYTPFVESIRPLCAFVARATNGNDLEFEFFRQFTDAPAPPLLLMIVLVVIAAIGGLRSLLLNGLVIAGVIASAQFVAGATLSRELAIPPFCSAVDPRTNTLVYPTAAQITRIRPVQK